MRIDSPLMTNAIATGSFSGSFTGAFDGDITADSVAYANITGKPTLISSSAQITALGYSTTDNELTTEEVQDIAGALVATGGTKTGITVTYDDDNGNMDFVVASQTDENFTSADHSKLDGIEASADVTDTANVTSAGALMDSELSEIATVKALTAAGISGSFTAASASFSTRVTANDAKLTANTSNVTSAGALMDSEVTNLAEVKAFDSSDYATAAQGAKADSAQQPPSEGAFANGDKTKLDGIEASADVTDTANVTSAGALMDSECTSLASVKALNQGVATGNSPTFSGLTISNDVTINGDLSVLGDATELQVSSLSIEDKNILIASGAADSAAADGAGLTIGGANETLTWDHGNSRFAFSDDLSITGNIVVSGTVDGRDVATDGTKLDGIESSATADQSDAEIRAAVEAASDSNVFTDADHSKLNGIEASADVTDTTNVTAAGALMDSECASLASVKAINQGLTTTSDVRFDSIGIGTAAPGTSGVLRATNDIVAFYSSDERLKDNIEEIPNCLGRLKDIKGVEFDWNDKQSVYEGHDIGVIAQDIEKIAPSLVTDRDNGYKAVKYEKLTAILIQAVKELHAKVEELENK
jgi:hypothetical protein